MHGIAPAALSIAVVLLAPAAWAEAGRPIALDWSSSAPDCLSKEALSSIVEHTLGRAVFHQEGRPVATIEVGVTAAAGQYEARIASRDEGGRLRVERVLTTDADCSRLDDSIAVVVALMVDALEDEPTVLHVETRPRMQPLTGAGVGLTLGLGGGASSGLLPGLAVMALLRGEVEVPRFVPVSLSLRVHTPSSRTLGGASATFTAWDGELAVCPAFGPGALRLGGCVGIGAGTLSGSPTGALTSARGDVQPFMLADALAFAALRVAGPVWLRLEAGGFVPLLRDGWGFLDASGAFVEVYRPAAVAPTAAVSLELKR
jgi:hypothetical protein